MNEKNQIADCLIDIVICTYDRDHILHDCLFALSKINTPQSLWSLILVNNYSQSIGALSQSRFSDFSNLHVLHEKSPGLSHARNRGIKFGNSEWIAFIDDDALVEEGYLDKVLEIIQNEQFDCFGGHIQSWWKYPRPRWMKIEYGSKPKLRKERGVIDEGYNWGSNIIIKRSVLERIDGFPVHVGLKGKKIGYSAENVVQDKIRSLEYTIGYDPDLRVNHLVLPHKFSLRWQILSAYATGRDGKSSFPDQYGTQGLINSLKRCIVGPVKGLYRLMTKPDFYWENLILDTAKPIALLAGKLRTFIAS